MISCFTLLAVRKYSSYIFLHASGENIDDANVTTITVTRIINTVSSTYRWPDANFSTTAAVPIDFIHSVISPNMERFENLSTRDFQRRERSNLRPICEASRDFKQYQNVFDGRQISPVFKARRRPLFQFLPLPAEEISVLKPGPAEGKVGSAAATLPATEPTAGSERTRKIHGDSAGEPVTSVQYLDEFFKMLKPVIWSPIPQTIIYLVLVRLGRVNKR